jgi:hypothetical protein
MPRARPPLPRQTRNRKRHFPFIKPGADAAPDPTVLEPILIVAIVIALTAWYVQPRLRKTFGSTKSTPGPQKRSRWRGGESPSQILCKTLNVWLIH